MNIAFFGGTFDPPHYGHFAVCTLVRELINPDKVIFSLSKNPLKNLQSSNERHRLNMLNILVDELNQTGPIFDISDWEIKQSGPSYSIDTLNYIKEKYSGAKIFLCIGQDNYAIFHKWKSYKQILDLCHIVVFARPGSHSASVESPFKPDAFTWIDLDMPLSSTECRQDIASNQTSCFQSLPSKIASYIQENHLYEN